MAIPGERLPHRHAAHVTVERQDIAGDDRNERAQAAAPPEPAEHERGNQEPGPEHDTGTRRDRSIQAPRAPGCGRRAHDPVQPRLRLHRHPRAERKTRPDERPERAAALPATWPPPARLPGGIRRAGSRAGPLARRRRSGDRARREGLPPPRPSVTEPPAVHEEESAGGRQPGEVEDAPRRSPGPATRRTARWIRYTPGRFMSNASR